MRRKIYESSQEDEYLCPDCGLVLEDLSAGCPKCRVHHQKEHERRNLIRCDPHLSHIQNQCRTLRFYRNAFLVFLILSAGVYVLSIFLGFLRSWREASLFCLLVFSFLFSLLALVDFFQNRRLYRLSIKVLRKMR